MSVFNGMWLPIFLLSPIGIFLTYKAMHDSAIMNLDAYTTAFRKATGFFQRLFGEKEIAEEKI